MALAKFNAPTLPNPPAVYDPQYIRELIRSLELYHNQLDSSTPNYAESYTADYFRGLLMPTKMTTAQKLLTPVIPDTPTQAGTIGMVLYDTDLNKLCVMTPTGWQTITSV